MGLTDKNMMINQTHPIGQNGRRSLIYGLLITVAVAMAAGRIASVMLVYEPVLHRNEEDPPGKRKWPKKVPRPMPTFSSNDRSRWATVRALVEEGTYVVGQRDPVTKKDSGIIFHDGYESVDKVLHPETWEFYSSKPPLLSTLVAGLYWILHFFGWNLTEHPFAVVRIILLFINGLPFLLYLLILARWVDRFGTTEWGKIYVFAAACFGTLVTPFLITFNNHTVGTFAVLFALDAVLRIHERKNGVAFGSPLNGAQPNGAGLNGGMSNGGGPNGVRGLHFALAGFWAGFAACNELPALSLVLALFFLLVWIDWKRTMLWFAPAALVPIAAFLLTNYLAIGQLRPAYDQFGTSWYEYEGSHWQKPKPGQVKTGIDWARYQETRLEYAFHVLLGHHGLFSLSPIWLLALGAMFVKRRAASAEGQDGSALHSPGSALPWFLLPLTLTLTIVVLGFYLVKSDNYGGWTVGLRWLMWLTPLWLLCMVPVADHLAECRLGRKIAYLLLVVSVFSIHYSLWNPWRHPWIYDLMMACGWKGY